MSRASIGLSLMPSVARVLVWGAGGGQRLGKNGARWTVREGGATSAPGLLAYNIHILLTIFVFFFSCHFIDFDGDDQIGRNDLIEVLNRLTRYQLNDEDISFIADKVTICYQYDRYL